MLTFDRNVTIHVRMANMSPRPTDTISSLAKGLRVVEFFAAETPRLSISDVARMTGRFG